MKDLSPIKTWSSPPTVAGILVVFFLFSWFFLAPAASADPESAGADPSISIDDLSPEILVDEDEVALTVHVEAERAEQLRGARITTFVHADPFTTISEVDDFLAEGRNDSWSAYELTLEEADIQSASAGGVDIQIMIPFESLPLWNQAAWGAYGVTVRLLPSSGYFDFAAPQDRTLLMWYPPGSSGSMQANVTITGVSDALAPSTWPKLAGTGTTLSLTQEDLRVLLSHYPDRKLEVATIPSGDASLSLLAVTDQPELFDLAASTRVHDEQRSPEDATESNDESSESGDLADSSLMGSQSGDVQSGDSGGVGQVAPIPPTDSNQKLRRALENAGISLVDDLLIAEDEWWGLQVIASAAKNGDTVLSGTKGVSEIFTDSSTPSARFLVDANTGSTIVSDDQSAVGSQDTVAVLDSWQTAAEALSSEARDTYGDLNARQRVRALTAISATQGTGDLSVWLNIPAVELGDNPPERLAELLDNPWVNPLSLQDMLRSPLSSIAREPIDEAFSVDAAEVAGALSPLDQELTATEDVLSASVDGERPTAAQLLPVLASTASGLTIQQRQERIDSAMDILRSFTKTIDVIPSGPVNIVGRNAPFPVTVRNSGPYALEILVGLKVDDPRLAAKQWVRAVIPSGGSVTVQVPVQAVGTGQVGVTAVAMTEGGTTLDVSEPIAVRVRADWEGPGLWIIAGLLSVALIAGVVRTIRKGKRRMSPQTTTSSKKDDG